MTIEERFFEDILNEQLSLKNFTLEKKYILDSELSEPSFVFKLHSPKNKRKKIYVFISFEFELKNTKFLCDEILKGKSIFKCFDFTKTEPAKGFFNFIFKLKNSKDILDSI